MFTFLLYSTLSYRTRGFSGRHNGREFNGRDRERSYSPLRHDRRRSRSYSPRRSRY